MSFWRFLTAPIMKMCFLQYNDSYLRIEIIEKILKMNCVLHYPLVNIKIEFLRVLHCLNSESFVLYNIIVLFFNIGVTVKISMF